MAPPKDPESGPVLVFTTARVDLLPVARSLLQAAEIPFIVQGEHGLGLLPTGLLAGPFAKTGTAARIFVPAAHAAAARTLLETTFSSQEEES